MSIKNNTAASARLHTTHRIRRHTHRRSIAKPLNDQMSTSSGAIRSVGDKQREQRHVKTETRSFVYNKVHAFTHTKQLHARLHDARRAMTSHNTHNKHARSAPGSKRHGVARRVERSCSTSPCQLPVSQHLKRVSPPEFA